MEKIESAPYKNPDKETFFSTDNIEIRLSPIHRYGVFTKKDIAPKETIEECPVILCPKQFAESQEELIDRVFFWDDISSAFVLGYGLLYNHDKEPNADFYRDYQNKTIRFIASKPIPAGQEVLIDYGETWLLTRGNHLSSAIINQELQNKRDGAGVLKVTALFLVLLVLSIAFPVGLHSKTPTENNVTELTIN